MKNGMKFKVTLFIVLFLLLIALIIYILTGSSEREYYNPNPVQATASVSPISIPTSVPTPVPTVAPAVPTATPVPVPTFSPTPYMPAATPTPFVPTPDIFLTETPMPTATPSIYYSDPVSVPSGSSLGTGVFQSDSGSSLNIHAVWSAVTNTSGTAEVTVIVYADHYTISYQSYENLFISLGENYQKLYSSDIYSTVPELQHTELGRTVFTVPYVPGEMRMWPLKVEWHFNGTYGKDANGNPIELPVIECGGMITLP